MEDYQKLYHKLFNAMTDLAAEARALARRIEVTQQECEDIVLNDTLNETGGAE